MARLCSEGMDVQGISWLVLEGHDLRLASNGQQWLTIDSIGSLAWLQLAMVGWAWLRASSQWLGHRSWPRGAWNHMVAFQGIVSDLRER